MKLLNIYQKLLGMYPKSYRKDYAAEMAQTLQDMLLDQPKRSQRAMIWIAAFAELPLHVIRHNVSVVEHAYSTDMPTYIKRNTRLSASLILPFIVLLTVNELRPSALPTAPGWTDMYRLLAIGLPAVAFLLSVATMLRWFVATPTAPISKTSRALTDIKHNWPIALVGSFALLVVVFMLGHDSAHCIAGNPIKEARNITTTLHCIEQN